MGGVGSVGFEDGWRPDPYGRHEERFYFFGSATNRVRDAGVESEDVPARRFAEEPGGPARPGPAPANRPPSARVRTTRQPTTRAPGARTPATRTPLFADSLADGQLPGGRPPLSRMAVRRIAAAVVLGACGVAVLAVALGAGSSSAGPASARQTTTTTAPPTTTTTAPTTTTTVPPTTTTTQAVPSAPRASADQAATAFVQAWAAGNQAQALTVATPAAVTTMFANHYQAGFAIDRGCNLASPATCAFGPPGGASPADPLYSITVNKTPTGAWYVSSVQVEG